MPVLGELLRCSTKKFITVLPCTALSFFLLRLEFHPRTGITYLARFVVCI